MKPAVASPQLQDDTAAKAALEAVGRVVLLEGEIRELRERIASQDAEIRRIRAQQEPSDRRRQEEEQRLFDEKTAAEMLGFTTQTLYRWRMAGLIQCVTFPGGDIRYSGKQIQDFIDTRRSLRGKLKLA